jgi:iron complex outermembrane recepter protein
MEVVKGPYALTWGAGNLSAIRVTTQDIPAVASRPRGNVSAAYNENLGAEEATTNIYGRSGHVGYVIDGAWRQGDDYTAGDGSIVPADYKSWEGRGKLAFDVGSGGLLTLAGGYQRQGPIDYPGRLLNAKYFHSPNFSGTFDWKGDGTLRSFQFQAYNNHVEHMMSNYDKPTAMDMPGRTPPFALDITVNSALNVAGGRLDAQLDLGGPWTGEVGGDVYSARRDAERKIARQSTGMVMFDDNMWPNAVVTDGGLFARVGWRQGAADISGTVRGDYVYADAQSSKVNQFFYDNNPSGGNLKATETNLSAALTTAFNLQNNWVLNLGVGGAGRTADASERYSDRIPSSKAQFAAEFMGDPQLKPEASTQGDIWLDGRYPNLQLHLAAFARTVSNYITIEATGLPHELPLSPPTVYQYINGDARFYGLEGSTSVGLGPLVTATLNGSYLYGQDTQLDEPAIGVAPVSGSLDLRYEEAQGRYYLEADGNATGKQTRVATMRGETPTPGYQTLDLRGGFGMANGVTVRGGVLNVFDKYYWDHLNAKNPFTGQPVPEAGRVLFVNVAWAF